MQRLRFTLLAVCLVLLFLGYNDLSLLLRNPQPAPISAQELESGQPPREWLRIDNGVLLLDEAINTSGTHDVRALLLPLVSAPGHSPYRIMVETRDELLLKTFTTYHFAFSTALERNTFRENNAHIFVQQRPVSGMLQSSLVAGTNEDRLRRLAQGVGMNVAENVLFVSEGKQPERYRGYFFTAIAVLGMGRILLGWKKSGKSGTA